MSLNSHDKWVETSSSLSLLGMQRRMTSWGLQILEVFPHMWRQGSQQHYFHDEQGSCEEQACFEKQKHCLAIFVERTEVALFSSELHQLLLKKSILALFFCDGLHGQYTSCVLHKTTTVVTMSSFFWGLYSCFDNSTHRIWLCHHRHVRVYCTLLPGNVLSIVGCELKKYETSIAGRYSGQIQPKMHDEQMGKICDYLQKVRWLANPSVMDFNMC